MVLRLGFVPAVPVCRRFYAVRAGVLLVSSNLVTLCVATDVQCFDSCSGVAGSRWWSGLESGAPDLQRLCFGLSDVL